METKLVCLSLAACLLASCEKSESTANPDSTSSKKLQMEARVEPPTLAEKPAPEASVPTDAPQVESSPEPLTPEQTIAGYHSNGIAGVPKDVADGILRKSTRAESPEEQLRFITEQSEAWRRINGFNETVNDIPDHMKRFPLEKLSTKHGDSWKDMATELDEQVAASKKVMELRLKGIPGMSPDESHDLIIQAIEKHGADYKAILSIAEQSARK